MPINQLLLGEYDHERANTKKTLERVPLDKWDWKSHTKSGTLGWMAGHVATLPRFAVNAVNLSELEIAGASFPKVEKPDQLLSVFDNVWDEGRAALAKVTDEQLQQNWTLKYQGKVIFTMPRYSVIRGMCLNHIVHHRGQLTMYLRALDVPVPALHGPSADEQNF